jgi:hypothetical protein
VAIWVPKGYLGSVLLCYVSGVCTYSLHSIQSYILGMYEWATLAITLFYFSWAATSSEPILSMNQIKSKHFRSGTDPG